MTARSVLPVTRLGRRLLLGAASAGLVHAAFSLYWAVGDSDQPLTGDHGGRRPPPGRGIHPDGGYDRQAMFGHTLLWDPLFLVWGVLLLSGLATTRGWRVGVPTSEGHEAPHRS